MNANSQTLVLLCLFSLPLFECRPSHRPPAHSSAQLSVRLLLFSTVAFSCAYRSAVVCVMLSPCWCHSCVGVLLGMCSALPFVCRFLSCGVHSSRTTPAVCVCVCVCVPVCAARRRMPCLWSTRACVHVPCVVRG
jgi:hypothetical protein